MAEQDAPSFEPFDISLEQAALGVALVDNATIDQLSALLDPETFSEPLHQRIFDMMCMLQTEGPVTPLILGSVMKTDPGLQSVGGFGYLAGLADAAPALPNIPALCRPLKDLAARRKVIALAEGILEDALRSPHDLSTDKLAEGAADDLAAILAETKRGDLGKAIKASEAAYELSKRIESQAVADKPFGVKPGIGILNDYLKAIFPGKLIVAGGRPGHGKSILATSIAKNVAARTLADGSTFGIPVDYLSGEMGDDELSARIVCDLEFDDAIANRLKPLEYGSFTGMDASGPAQTRFGLATQKLSDLDLEILYRPGMTLEWIESTCRRRSRKKPGHRLVIIDHLQLVSLANARRGANRTEIQTEITGRLKALAGELGITFLLLSQLNRDLEKRDDKHPTTSDLREGGSIEQDADVIIFIMRPQVYAEEKIRAARGEEERNKAILEYDNAKDVLEIALPKIRGGKALYKYLKCYINAGASAIRDAAPDGAPPIEELKF